MAIIFFDSLNKGENNVATLDLQALYQKSLGLNFDVLFQDLANWKKVVFTYKSKEANQINFVSFDIERNILKGDFSPSFAARDEWEIVSIKIFDFDNDYVIIKKEELVEPEFNDLMLVKVPMVLSFDTTLAGFSGVDSIVLPIDITSQTGSFTIDWGDGNVDTYTGSVNTCQHTYASSGVKDIEIMAEGDDFRGKFDFGNGIGDPRKGDLTKITDIKRWGNSFIWTEDSSEAFYGCSNMDCTAEDAPDLRYVDSMSYFMYGCSSLQQIKKAWDASTVTDFSLAWTLCSSLTSFPKMNMSSGVNFQATWTLCSSLASFPEIRMDNGVNFQAAWQNCSSLTSFPVLSFPNGDEFSAAWYECTGLVSFPEIDFSNATRFNQAWYGCSGLTSFSAKDFSSGDTFIGAWQDCSGLTSFPLADMELATTVQEAWLGCVGLLSFPNINLNNVTDFRKAWQNCSSINVFELTNTENGVDFTQTWFNCLSLTSFPAIMSGNALLMPSCWYNCSGLTSFPLIDTSNVTNFQSTWYNCIGLTSFPLIDTFSATNLQSTWQQCSGLTSFPLIDTSNATNLRQTWQLCSSLVSFPLINTSNVDIFIQTWNSCSNLNSFPLIDTSNGLQFNNCWGNTALTPASNFPTIDLSSMTVGTNMFLNVDIGTTSWDSLLINTDSLNQNNAVDWSGGNAKYTAGSPAETARNNLTARGWTITDGGSV